MAGVASTTLLHVILYGLALCALMPFLFMFCACFKTQEDIFRYPLIPWRHLDDLTLENFRALFATKPFAQGDVLVAGFTYAPTKLRDSGGAVALARSGLKHLQAVTG